MKIMKGIKATLTDTNFWTYAVLSALSFGFMILFA